MILFLTRQIIAQIISDEIAASTSTSVLGQMLTFNTTSLRKTTNNTYLFYGHLEWNLVHRVK